MIDSNLVLRNNIARLLLRDLAAVRREVELYPDDASLFAEIPGLTNAGGTLVLHLAGNLQHFIGRVLGNTDYVRTREVEFSRRDATRFELLQQLDATRAAVTETMRSMHPSVLEGVYPQEVAKVQVPTDMFLLHLATHLAYHLGQLDYHRRSVTGNSSIADTVSIPALLEPFPPIGL